MEQDVDISAPVCDFFFFLENGVFGIFFQEPQMFCFVKLMLFFVLISW